MKSSKLSRVLTLLAALVMLATVITATAITAFAAAPASYTDIYLNSPQYVSVSGSGRYFRFIPEVSGRYRIYSYGNSGDPKVYLKDYQGVELNSDDDGGGSSNFDLYAELYAGNTYYINATSWNNGSSRYTFTVELIEAYTPAVTVSTDGETPYGGIANFYVSLQNIYDVTDIEITPVFDENVFEFVGGEWTIDGEGTIDPDTMTATMSYEEVMNIDGQVYIFSLRAKAEAASTDVSVSANVKCGDEVVDFETRGVTTSVAPCNHYYGTSVEIDEAYHEFTCDACGHTITREHLFSDDNDLCCNEGCGYHRGLVGDVDNDGDVDPDDALWVLDYYYDNYWSYTMSVGYDFNKTGYVDEYDAYNLLMYVYFPDTVICDCTEHAIENRALETAPVGGNDNNGEVETLYRDSWVYINNYSENDPLYATYGAFEIDYDPAVMEFLYMNCDDLPDPDYNEIVYCVNNRLVFAYRSERSIYYNNIYAELRVLEEAEYGDVTVNTSMRTYDVDNEIISEINSCREYFISCYGHNYVENPAEEYLKKAASCKSKATYYLSCETCGHMSPDTFKYGDLADHKWVEEDGEEFCSVCDELKSGGKRPNNSNNKNNNTSGESDINPIIIIAIAAGVVVVVVVVIVIIAAGKKKKKNAAAIAPDSAENAELADDEAIAAPEQNAENVAEAQSYAAPEQGYAPQYGAPQGYAPQYGATQGYAPQYGAPQGDAPQYGAPQYGAPQYGAPQYGAPQYGAPQYGAPQYGAPQYGAPQYGAPQYGAPQTEAPQGDENAQQ